MRYTLFEDLASRVVLAFHDPRASGVVVRGQGNEDHEVAAAGGVHVHWHREEPGVDLAEAEKGDDDEKTEGNFHLVDRSMKN